MSMSIVAAVTVGKLCLSTNNDNGTSPTCSSRSQVPPLSIKKVENFEA
jgi:hypothetical protein